MRSQQLTRRDFLATTTALGVAGLIPAFPGAARAQATNVLRIRLESESGILDPGYMVGGVDVEAQKACLPFLAEYTRDGDTLTWKPTYFVTRLEQVDPTHIEFDLAAGLVWSRGFGTLTAQDVKFSYERMKTTDWAGYFEALESVEVTGDLTGTIVLNKPFAPFFMVTLCHGPGAILCEKAVNEAGGRFTTDFPAVCGPYTYSVVPGQRALFEANPEWTGPRPHFDRVEGNIISEVKAAELAFEAGELDCTELGPDALARYQTEMPAGAKVTVAGELLYQWLGMNTEHPKLQDIRVRKAIQRAIDVDSILAGAYSNTSTKSHGVVCPGLLGQRMESGYSYAPDEAMALLEEAGVSGLELTLRTLNVQERMLTAQIIQANLAAVGITMTILPLESGPYWEMGAEASGETWRDLEIWLMRFGTVPDPYESMQWFVSEQVGIWNWERWTDPAFDQLYQDGMSEQDPDLRRDIYLQMQQIMEDTGAYVWINHEPRAFAHRDTIVIDAAPSGELNYRNFTAA